LNYVNAGPWYLSVTERPFALRPTQRGEQRDVSCPSLLLAPLPTSPNRHLLGHRPLSGIVAKKVIGVHTNGVNNPAEIADVTVRRIGLP